MLRYLWSPYDNSDFYGVSSRALASGTPMHGVIGGDWLFVAEVAGRGAIVTQPETTIHRAIGGTSSNLSSIAETLRLENSSRAFPFLRLATLTFSEVAKDTGVFEHRSTAYRFWAGALLALTIIVRHELLHKIRSAPAHLGQWILGETRYARIKRLLRRG